MRINERVAKIETEMNHLSKTQDLILEEIKALNRFKWYISGAGALLGVFVVSLTELVRMFLDRYLNHN
jgi:hypothetical protein